MIMLIQLTKSSTGNASFSLVGGASVFLLFSLVTNYAFINANTQDQNNINIKPSLNSIPINKIKINDIEIAYKIFGKGDPLVLINGYRSIMGTWNENLLQDLAVNHTVVIFDNRGIGNTTIGKNELNIGQFAKDTFGLINALRLNKTNIMGFSMGGMIAQELVLSHPDKVRKLVIYASSCGGKDSVPLRKDLVELNSNNSITFEEVTNSRIPFMFPEEWIKENPLVISNYTKFLQSNQDLFPQKILDLQEKAIGSWKGTCSKLGNVTTPTLILVGTKDEIQPLENSIILTQKIPGSHLIKIEGGGHGMMHQFPEKISTIVSEFLSN
jgi:pimeloyl-ACP methyl ester carboxylesterase